MLHEFLVRIKNLFRFFLLRYGLKSIAKTGILNAAVRLEVSSKCQLLCPLCITGLGLTRKENTKSQQTVSWGNLRFADFKSFVLKNPQIKTYEISNYGEIFLNKELPEILQFAYQKRLKLIANNGVNLNTLSDEMAEALVKYKFYKLKVSVDGASQETYRIYRKGGDYEKVIANIKKINFYKEKYNSEYPKLKWQFIIFGHNEHELPMARLQARELGMGFKPKLNFRTKKFAVKDAEFVKKESCLGVATLEEYEEKNKKMYSPACMQLWTAPQVNWDGKLLGCCVNNFSDFGNVFEEGLDTLLKSEKYVYTKQMLMGQKPLRDDLPCTHCKRMKTIEKRPITKAQILAEFQFA